MKNLISFLFAFYLLILNAQENLVPMRVKDKFGLADMKGRIVLKPEFDDLYIMGNNYFGYVNNHFIKDTVHWVGGRIEVRDRNMPETGVIHNKKKLISGQNYPVFTVMDEVILGGESRSYIENAMLFNLWGEPLFDREIATFQAWNPIHDENGNMTHKLIITAFEDKTFEIAVFDMKNGRISERILQNINSLRLDGGISSEVISVKYADENNYYFEKHLSVKDGKYVLSDQPEYAQNRGQEYFGYHNETPPTMERAGEPVVEMMKSPKKPPQPSRSVTPVKRPDVFSVDAENRLLVNNEVHPVEGKVSFELIGSGQAQTEPVIFSLENGQKGLFSATETANQPLYDHLQYIKNQHGITIYSQRYFYYAGRRDDSGKMKYGIITADGNAVVPLMYDSIQVNMLESKWNTDDESNRKIELKEPYYYEKTKRRVLQFDSSGFLDSNKGFMVAFLNSKCGLIGIDNQVFLPLEYDQIFKNGYSFTQDNNYEMKDEFIVLKKDGKFGMIEFSADKKVEKFIPPVFPEMPTRYYPNYNGQKGLMLFALSTADEVTFCYATGEGKVFLK